MLIQLNIKQFGIIENATLELGRGLTVLSGETGAGKSMLLAAISQLSGQRTSTSYIRHGEDKATVEGIFDFPSNDNLTRILEELDIEIDEDVIIIRRDIYSSGKSVCRVNNTIVNLTTLKNITSYLLDIHEQHDNQILLVEKNHIALLDSYGKDNLYTTMSSYKEKYKEYKTITEKINILKNQESEVLQKIDFLKYQYEEIDSLELEKDEDISLQEEIDYLQNYEKINTITYAISEDLSSDYGVLTSLYNIKENLNKLSKYNNNFEEKSEEITNLYYILEDLQYDLSRFNNHIEYDENRLNEVEFRLSKIKSLEKKYSKSLNELILFKENIKQELYDLENYEENVSHYIENQSKLEAELKLLADKLTNIRKDVAKELETKIQEELKFLCMEKSIIKIDFKEKDYSNDGKDNIKILISANYGEPLKSLSKVASGGELSRIMLALKIIFSSSIDAISIIFDEIDTGVSGRVSQRMAEKMYQLAVKSQVLCISHLPQTTSLADNNLLIIKEVVDERTISTIKVLTSKEKVEEVARMMSGTTKTKLSLQHALEMEEISNFTREEITKRVLNYD
ncbi:DNA repair protein RecN [Gemella sp. GH3]|uniref:DNA repair protein RecN n=1 Tax=unclassified Gemella TaxID=2624949 RepID=UPI0015CFB2A3|nr:MULTISPECIES: DNA repair protein RecN [unclassified Gemella]MBF0713248.1 DNA repair protein RecN [Gemella sp. GH3.1]NYS50200.1 DNA repair protein RecN [Gemella sp. GH3]